MRRSILAAAAMATSALVAGCVSITAAPGSAAVRITRVAGDVSACKAVGNVEVTRSDVNSAFDVDAALRNKAVGLGADVVLVTSASGLSGVAYHCG